MILFFVYDSESARILRNLFDVASFATHSEVCSPMTDIQKAPLLKRFSAFLLDFILLVIFATGVAALMSVIIDFGKYNDKLDETKRECIEAGIDMDHLDMKSYKSLTDEQKATYAKYEGALENWFNLILLIVSLSFFFAYFVMEFLLPLLVFKNGRTVGKKVFGIGVMHTTGVKISTFGLFARTILGKYTIETMGPIIILMVSFFMSVGPVPFLVLIALTVFQIILFFASKTFSFIHDAISTTVAVDMATQLIFDSYDEKLDYIEQQHRLQVEAEANPSVLLSQKRNAERQNSEEGEIGADLLQRKNTKK